MSTHGPAPHPPPNGSRRRAVCFAALLAVLAAWPARTARAWSDTGHDLITEEAVQRLPQPLRSLFADPPSLNRLKAASIAADGRTDAQSPHYSPAEKPRHFFDIDAVADEPPPFATFPRDRAEAERQFGAETFEKTGTAPWAAGEALDRLVDALRDGRTGEVFAAAGDLAHYATDLHMPLHTTKNWDGQLTGNHGIHKALEVGLVNRRLDACRAEVQSDRRVVHYLADPTDHLFDWLIAAHARVEPILEADTAARQATRYNPAQHPEDLDQVDSAQARPYYKALAEELAKRGSPEAAALREASAHLADLLYTAWVRAGKPVTLQAAAQAADAEPTPPYWLIALAVGLLLLLVWPRRRPARRGGDASGPTE
ncbi:MAG: hypothetical protein ISS74_09405 [Planctomycetes bacterium]|nr:hypothetical protein [Planctomycetota bacterium]